MMATRPSRSLFRGAGRNALDLPVAGLAALAAAFAAFAVPQELLSSLVNATGLPSVLAAAQPPLGLTARVAVAVAGAALVFGLVFLLLRLLDRSGMNAAPAPREPRRPREPRAPRESRKARDTQVWEEADEEEEEEEERPAPRLRRRDVHPDAPPPRPISAARDLGEPAPPQAPRAAVPLWLDEAEPSAAPAGAQPEPAAEPDDEPILELVPEFQPRPEPALEPAPAPVPTPEAPAAVWHVPTPVVPAAVVVPQPEPEPVAVAKVEVEPQPEPVAEPGAELPTSISDLMDRLERGLAKRRPAPAATPAVAPQVFPEAAEAPDDRLQNAIASLQRLAARSSA